MTQDPETYSALGEVGAFQERRTLWSRLKLDLKKSPMTARFGMAVILIYAVVAIIAPLIAPYGEAEVFAESFAPWGSKFIFGMGCRLSPLGKSRAANTPVSIKASMILILFLRF